MNMLNCKFTILMIFIKAFYQCDTPPPPPIKKKKKKKNALLRDAAVTKNINGCFSLSTAYNFVCVPEKCEICQYANYAQVKISKITGKISSLHGTAIYSSLLCKHKESII